MLRVTPDMASQIDLLAHQWNVHNRSEVIRAAIEMLLTKVEES